MKAWMQGVVAVVLFFVLSNGMVGAEQDVKPRRIYVTMDASGSMLNQLDARIIRAIRQTVSQILFEGRYEAAAGIRIVTDNSGILKDRPLFRGGDDRWSFWSYGTTLDRKIDESTSDQTGALLDLLPQDRDGFAAWFKQPDTLLYLPEMALLEKFDSEHEVFWIDISDNVFDGGVNAIPQALLEKWDRLHEGVNTQFVLFRARAANGIFVTMRKVADDAAFKLRFMTGDEQRVVLVYDKTAESLWNLESLPAQIVADKGSLPTMRIRGIELELRDPESKKTFRVKARIKSDDLSSLKDVVFEDKTDTAGMELVKRQKQAFVRVIYQDVHNREYRYVFRNLPLLLQEKNATSFFVTLLLILAVLAGLALLFALTRLILGQFKPRWPVELSLALAGSFGKEEKFVLNEYVHKIVFDPELRGDSTDCHLFRGIKMEQARLDITPDRKGIRCLVTPGDGSPAMPRFIEESGEVVLKNKFGKEVPVRIEILKQD